MEAREPHGTLVATLALWISPLCLSTARPTGDLASKWANLPLFYLTLGIMLGVTQMEALKATGFRVL